MFLRFLLSSVYLSFRASVCHAFVRPEPYIQIGLMDFTVTRLECIEY